MTFIKKVPRTVLPSQTLRYEEMAQSFPPEFFQSRLMRPEEIGDRRPFEPVPVCYLGWSIYGGVLSSAFRSVAVNFHVATASDLDKLSNVQLAIAWLPNRFRGEQTGGSSFGIYNPANRKLFRNRISLEDRRGGFPRQKRKIRQHPDHEDRVAQQIRDY